MFAGDHQTDVNCDDDATESDTCHECGELADGYDYDGTPACRQHLSRNRNVPIGNCRQCGRQVYTESGRCACQL